MQREGIEGLHQTMQVKDLVRLSLRDPEYIAVHAEAAAPTPLKLQQVRAFLQKKELGSSANGNLSLSSIFKIGRATGKRKDPFEYGAATTEMLLKDAVVKDFLDDQGDPAITGQTEENPHTLRSATTMNMGVSSGSQVVPEPSRAMLHGPRSPDMEGMALIPSMSIPFMPSMFCAPSRIDHSASVKGLADLYVG